MNEIRNMALLLRPSMLDDFGLVPALDWQAREIGKRTGLRVQVASEVAGELPEEHKTCIYRVVQEALNNCARHAQASAVQVAVRSEPAEILVTVQDDGSGFDTARVRGMGLLGMEERVRHLGGTFRDRFQTWPRNAASKSSCRSRPCLPIAFMETPRRETAFTEVVPMETEKMENVRILLADDHNILRDGMRLLLERQPGFVVVGEAADGREIVDLAREQRPDVIVMDIAMPNMNGIEATRRIVEKQPEIGVVILSMHYDESYVIRSLKAGARAYLLKDALKAELISAIRAVSDGRSFFSPKSQPHSAGRLRSKRSERKDADDSYDLLTAREREILQLVAEGKTNKEIANTLNVSLYTVDTHRTHILQKLNLHSVPELILYAVRKGIIS